MNSSFPAWQFRVAPGVKLALFLPLLVMLTLPFNFYCLPESETTALPLPSDQVAEAEASNSPFGIFGAYALEYTYFQQRMTMDNQSYWNWVDSHFRELGAHWTRSNLQLIWDSIEPEPGKGYRWNNQFYTDSILTRIYNSPALVNWIGVFHEGGTNPKSGKPPLRDPMKYPEQYAHFVREAVERYDGDGKADLNSRVRVKYWQVGNEYPFWLDSGRTENDYINWARLTATAIKEADPEARVVLIAQTQGVKAEAWVPRAVAQLGPLVNAVDIHHWGPAESYRMGIYDEIFEMLHGENRHFDVEIFSLENGTWAGSPPGLPPQTEEDQARSLIKRYVYNTNQGLDRLLWNNLMEWDSFGGNTGSIYNSMGLLSDGRNSGDNPDRFNTPRIAYYSYQTLSKYLGSDIKNSFQVRSGENRIYRFPPGDKYGVRYVGWSEAGIVDIEVEEAGFNGLSMSLVPDRFGNAGGPKKIKSDDRGILKIRLSPNPVLLVSDR